MIVSLNTLRLDKLDFWLALLPIFSRKKMYSGATIDIPTDNPTRIIELKSIIISITYNSSAMVVHAKKILKLGFWVLALFVLVSLPAIYLNGRITINDFKNYILSFGLWAPIIFILATAVTNIIPPLAATVFWITGVVLFGPFYGAIFSYTANLLGSSTNYFIAFIWGRPAVIKLAGEGSLKEIDKYAKATRFIDLILLKMFSGAASDYVSYAAGLAKVPFWVHFSAVGYGIIPMMAIGFYLIYRGSGGNLYAAASFLGIFYVINYSTTLILVPLIYRLSINSQNQTQSSSTQAQ